MGDDERANIGRVSRHTPPQGWPVEIDPEETPPPQEPPKPSEVAGYDTIAPPLRQQLEILSDGLAQVTEAIGRVWDARKDTGRIDKLVDGLSGMREDLARLNESLREFVLPAIKSLQATSGALWEHHLHNRGRVELFYGEQFPRLVKSVDDLILRVGRNEDTQERHADQFSAHNERLLGLERTTREHDTRLQAIEQRNRDSQVALEASDKTKRKIFSTARLVWGGVAFVGGLVVSQWERIVAFFRGH